MRADAVRNRERILAAARERVAAEGPDVGMDAIAAAAGVAVGTLYRHHPTKADLIAAVVDDSVDQMAEAAERAVAAVAAGADPADELAALFREFARRHVEDRAVKSAAALLGTRVPGPDDPPGTAAARAGAAIAALLAEAQRAGRVRGDVGVAELGALLAGVPGLDVPADVRDRYVDVVLDGLRRAP